MRISRVLLLLSLLPLRVTAAHAQAAELPEGREELLGESTAMTEDDLGFQIASPASKQVAWAEKRSGRWVALLNGKQQGKEYDEVGRFRLSPDDKHLAFRARRGQKWVMVYDGQESDAWDFVTGAEFSPDSSRIAYGVCRSRKCRLFLDGQKQGPELGEMGLPGFSRDGQRIAYPGRRGRKWVLIVDHKPLGPEVDEIHSWLFSPDGKRVAAAARVQSDWQYVVDGQPGPVSAVIGYPEFSPDSQHYAYGAAASKGGLGSDRSIGTMVVDGQPGTLYQGENLNKLLTNLGGSYEYMNRGVRYLSCAFHGVSQPAYSSKGKLAYAARRGDGDAAVLVDGAAGPSFDDLASPIAFSADGEHIAYVARRGKTFVEVRDQQPGPSFPAEGRMNFVPMLAVTPDGEHVAYVLVQAGSMFTQGYTRRAHRRVVLDGQAGKSYDATGVANLQFSPDGKHLGYEVTEAGNAKSFVVLDGQEGKPYDAIFQGSLTFADNRTARYAVRQGRRFYLVTQTLP